ncbi:MAG: SCP2 sterol-binding domain-containing protein [Proteobacteria bacterium]|nr:SCP2 sterol-binding domain-containing protein [Pseudomonadota bacterium]
MEPTPPDAWLPRPLRRFAGRVLERAFAAALALDPETRQALAGLEGRRIGVHLRGPGIGFTIVVREGALRIEPPPDAADLRVTATPASLLAMAMTRGGETLPPGKIEIAGDAELARRVEKLASRFSPDIEAAFAGVFGEVVGVPIARVLRQATRGLRRGAAHAAQDSADWSRDEARLIAPRGEVDDFLDGVDALRERVERLVARVARLQARA